MSGGLLAVFGISWHVEASSSLSVFLFTWGALVCVSLCVCAVCARVCSVYVCSVLLCVLLCVCNVCPVCAPVCVVYVCVQCALCVLVCMCSVCCVCAHVCAVCVLYVLCVCSCVSVCCVCVLCLCGCSSTALGRGSAGGVCNVAAVPTRGADFCKKGLDKLLLLRTLWT